MKIAVEGCAHGELDKIYDVLQLIERQNGEKVDLLIICGDFQAVRNPSDLLCMAVPPKYRKLNTFYKYYSGEKTAPVLTIFIGGNHEASNYLSELPYGGWVCKNIYYMGYANVINVGGIRIGGLSGIYKGQDYLKGHFELLPYDESTKRSVYHVRNVDVFKLKQLKQPLDIFISHDWPRGIENYGDKEGLLRFKPFFKDDMESGKLGSRAAEELMHILRPTYWFAAHMHCRFTAVVPHEDTEPKKYTKFLALDKCLPRRRFLQILDLDHISSSSPSAIQYDPEWLCILRSTNHLLNISRNSRYMPGAGCSERWDFSVTDEEFDEMKELFGSDFNVISEFIKTAPCHNSNNSPRSLSDPTIHINPQTTKFCDKVGIDDPLKLLVSDSDIKNVKEYSFVEEVDVTNTSVSSCNPEDSFDSESLIEPEPLESYGSFIIDRGHKLHLTSSPKDNLTLADRLTIHKSFSGTPESRTSSVPDIDLSDINEISCNNPDPQTPLKKSTPFKLKRRNEALYRNDDENDST